jgi:UDP-N-acetylmuramyl pentapeptide phosphotransferase/UDP-N-acetylglucosamine-1-phosphate transferase
MRYAEIVLAGFLIILIGAVILTVLPSRLGFGEISREILYPLMIGVIIFASILMYIWTWRSFLRKKE